MRHFAMYTSSLALRRLRWANKRKGRREMRKRGRRFPGSSRYSFWYML
jgi:hypothetical protein